MSVAAKWFIISAVILLYSCCKASINARDINYPGISDEMNEKLKNNHTFWSFVMTISIVVLFVSAGFLYFHK